MSRGMSGRLEALEAVLEAVSAKGGRVPADPRCTPDNLSGMTAAELSALALELGVMAQPGQVPGPGQLPHLDGMTAQELATLYHRGRA